MRHHPSSCRLANSIIGDHYGEICRRVCNALLEMGTQSLKELAGSVEFPEVAAESAKERRRETERLLRRALLVLIQHNCVLSHLVHPEPSLRNSSPEPYHVYTADLPRILQALRKPRFQLHVREEYGGDADTDGLEGSVHEAIITALLENGRLRFEQIVPAAAEKLELSSEGAKEDIKAAFMQLVMDRYIERAVPCDLPPPPPPVFPKLKGARRAAAPKAGSEAAQKAEEEQNRQKSMGEYLETRYKLPAEFGLGPPTGKRAASAPPPAPAPVAKHRRGAQRTAAIVEPAAKPSPAKSEAVSESGNELWRISNSQFDRKFRYAAAVDFIREWHGKERASLAQAVLAASAGGGKAEPREEHDSPDVSEAAVRRVVEHWKEKESDVCPVAPEDVSKLLREVAEEAPEILRQKGASRVGGVSYCLSLKAIIESARQKELEAIVRQRFGTHGLRLWRCLLEHKQLEVKSLHERCLVPQKETRELLYHLLKAGFVAIQDIPRTADHAPSKTFYTWKVDLKAAGEQLAAHLLQAAGNLRARLQHELKARAQALELVDKNDEAGVASNTGTLQQAKAIGMQLDSHMLRLGRTIALFLDF